MAIQIVKETKIGITCPTAYVRIGRITVEKKTKLKYGYQIFASAEAANDPKVRAIGNGSGETDFDIENPVVNIYELAYNHLKTLDGFTEAIDV